jgi:hypothetical protein
MKPIAFAYRHGQPGRGAGEHWKKVANENKGHATHRRMSYAVPGSKYVNVMVMIRQKGWSQYLVVALSSWTDEYRPGSCSFSPFGS